MKNDSSCSERGVARDTVLETLIDLALGCYIVHLQTCSRGDLFEVVLTNEGI